MALEDLRSNDAACAAVGIHRDSFFEWMKRGRIEESGVYREFSDTIKKHWLMRKIPWLPGIRNAGSLQWQAMAWLLERRFRERWGRDLDRPRTIVWKDPPQEGPAK